MNRDPLRNPEAYETDEELREQPVDVGSDIAQKRGTSPLAGISGPQEAGGGKIGQESTELDTATSGKDWNVTSPVGEYGHRNAEGSADELTKEDSSEPQPE